LKMVLAALFAREEARDIHSGSGALRGGHRVAAPVPARRYRRRMEGADEVVLVGDDGGVAHDLVV
jgi:hypothetical protein